MKLAIVKMNQPQGQFLSLYYVGVLHPASIDDTVTLMNPIRAVEVLLTVEREGSLVGANGKRETVKSNEPFFQDFPEVVLQPKMDFPRESYMTVGEIPADSFLVSFYNDSLKKRNEIMSQLKVIPADKKNEVLTEKSMTN